MESGEISISRFLTSGVEPKARSSIRKYLTTQLASSLDASLVDWHQDLMPVWSSGQILTYWMTLDGMGLSRGAPNQMCHITNV